MNVGAPELLSDTLEQAGTGHCLKLVCEMEALVKASSYDLWLWELMSSAAPEDKSPDNVPFPLGYPFTLLEQIR